MLGKTCSLILIFFAFVFLALFILTILYNIDINFQVVSSSKSTTLEIPALSVIEVDLKSLNISTVKKRKLNVTALTMHKLIRVSLTKNKNTKSTRPFNLKLNTTIEKGQSKSMLRYWSNEDSVQFNIALDGTHYIAYKWGNITHPPPHDYCPSTSSGIKFLEEEQCTHQIFKKKQQDQNLIRIYFCSKDEENETSSTVIINITEDFPLLDELPYKYIYIDETSNSNSTVLEFHSIFSEIHENSRLYINTHHNTSAKVFPQSIRMTIKPESSEDETKVIDTVLLGVAAFAFLCLFVIFLIIGICCCCRCKDRKFYALAVFYGKKDA